MSLFKEEGLGQSQQQHLYILSCNIFVCLLVCMSDLYKTMQYIQVVNECYVSTQRIELATDTTDNTV